MGSQVGSCAAFLKFDYSTEGYPIRTHYLDQAGNPTAGMDGAFVLRRDFDPQGKQLRLLSLWKDDQPMNDKIGNAEFRSVTDRLGSTIVAEAFDAAGSPINLKSSGYQRIALKYDVYGNPVEQVFWKADGSPGTGEDGCHRVRYIYDERGSIVRVECLDQDGRPDFAYGQHFTAWQVEYDDKGRAVQFMYYDKNREPAKGPLGAFRVSLGYDTDDNITSIAYFSAGGLPTVGDSGFHKQISTFEAGREVRTDYVGVDGNPAPRPGGYVAIERRYDSHGNEERLMYIGAGRRPVLNQSEGFAIKRATFDTCGRETESRYFDENEKPTRSSDGYAGIKKSYDDSGNIVEEVHLDERGQYVRSGDDYAHVMRKFNRHRNIVEETYLDQNNNPLLMKGKYVKLTRSYDDHNALVEEAYFGVGGEPVLNEKGWARITYVKNSDGRNIETTYFGTNGSPLKLEKHYVKMTSRTNDRNALIEEAYFGTNGEPVPKDETVYFGPDGKPVKSEKSYAKLMRRYDDHNAMTEEAYFGANAQPMLNDGGWARITYVNDELGRAIEKAYFGLRGEPVIANEGFHRGKRVLDERGNMLELASFGTDGKPLAIKSRDGKRRCARFVWRFDAHNKEISSECFDTVGGRVR